MLIMKTLLLLSCLNIGTEVIDLYEKLNPRLCINILCLLYQTAGITFHKSDIPEYVLVFHNFFFFFKYKKNCTTCSCNVCSPCWVVSKGLLTFLECFYAMRSLVPVGHFRNTSGHLFTWLAAGLLSDTMGYCLPIVSCEMTRTKWLVFKDHTGSI